MTLLRKAEAIILGFLITLRAMEADLANAPINPKPDKPPSNPRRRTLSATERDYELRKREWDTHGADLYYDWVDEKGVKAFEKVSSQRIPPYSLHSLHARARSLGEWSTFFRARHGTITTAVQASSANQRILYYRTSSGGSLSSLSWLGVISAGTPSIVGHHILRLAEHDAEDVLLIPHPFPQRLRIGHRFASERSGFNGPSISPLH